MSEGGWVEVVPNFSEGRDPALVADLVATLERAGAIVLDHGADPDHHRSVLTFVARTGDVVEAAYRAAELALERIDLSAHAGVHPRLGATDVVPLVPLGGTSEARCVELAHELGRRLGEGLDLPVYFYGEAALHPARRELPEVRRRGREAASRGGLSDDPELRPDAGPARFHPTGGATVVGVRPFLIAFNVELASGDLALARSIARAVRASSGGLPAVRALGFPLESQGRVQVSLNLLDHRVTGLAEVVGRIAALAGEAGVEVFRSELIGLAPRAALDPDLARELRLVGYDPARQCLEERLAARGVELDPP